MIHESPQICNTAKTRFRRYKRVGPQRWYGLQANVIDLRKIDNHIYHIVTPALQSGG